MTCLDDSVRTHILHSMILAKDDFDGLVLVDAIFAEHRVYIRFSWLLLETKGEFDSHHSDAYLCGPWQALIRAQSVKCDPIFDESAHSPGSIIPHTTKNGRAAAYFELENWPWLVGNASSPFIIRPDGHVANHSSGQFPRLSNGNGWFCRLERAPSSYIMFGQIWRPRQGPSRRGAFHTAVAGFWG